MGMRIWNVTDIGCVIASLMTLGITTHASSGVLLSQIRSGQKPFDVFGRSISNIRGVLVGFENMFFIPLNSLEVTVVQKWRDLAEGLRQYFGKDEVVQAIIQDGDKLLGAIQVAYQQYLKKTITQADWQKLGVYGARRSSKVPWSDLHITQDISRKVQEWARQVILPVKERLVKRQNKLEGEFCIRQSCKDRNTILKHQNGEWLLIADKLMRQVDDIRTHVS